MTSAHAALATATGETDAARLYEKYGDQLYRYCLARLRSPEEAEDAVQSTFMRVHAALAKGTRPRFEAAWLYKIAQNVCLTRGMVSARRAAHESPGDPVVLEQLLPAPERSDELAGLPEALAAMPQNLRNAILLREWQGLSYAEIAERMGTTVGAVETLIFRARRHLAKALEPPARRPALARLLDVGWLYGAGRVLLARLGALLEGAGAAKLAAGAAALALGGAGIGTAVTVASSSRAPSAPTPHPAAAPVAAVAHGTPQVAETAVVTSTAVFPAARSVRPARRAHAAAPAAVPVAAQTVPAVAPAAPSAPAAGATPAAAAAPASTPAVQVPVLAPSGLATTTSPLPALPPPPTVTAPTLSTPTTPTLSTPTTPALPTATAPALPAASPLPTATTPALPSLTLSTASQPLP